MEAKTIDATTIYDGRTLSLMKSDILMRTLTSADERQPLDPFTRINAIVESVSISLHSSQVRLLYAIIDDNIGKEAVVDEPTSPRANASIRNRLKSPQARKYLMINEDISAILVQLDEDLRSSKSKEILTEFLLLRAHFEAILQPNNIYFDFF